MEWNRLKPPGGDDFSDFQSSAEVGEGSDDGFFIWTQHSTGPVDSTMAPIGMLEVGCCDSPVAIVTLRALGIAGFRVVPPNPGRVAPGVGKPLNVPSHPARAKRKVGRSILRHGLKCHLSR